MEYAKIKILLLLFSFFSLSKTEQMIYSSNSFKESIEQKNNPDQGFYWQIRLFLTPDSF